MTPEQCRMARAGLRWSVEDLATKSKLAKNTVLAFELGRSVRDRSINCMRTAFEAAGAKLIEVKKTSGVLLPNA